MIVIIDASVICRDFKLRGTNWRLLLDGIVTPEPSFAEHMLATPAVVVDEVRNKHRERYMERLDKTRTELRGLRELAVNPDALPTAEELVEEPLDEYWQSIDMTLDNGAWATVLPYPEITHADIVRRDLLRHKPFSQNGKGYRDALIWETVLETIEANKDDVIFITENHKDFGLKQGNTVTLHPDLLNDVRSRSDGTRSFQVFWSLDEFLEEYRSELRSRRNADLLQYINGFQYTALPTAYELVGHMLKRRALDNLEIGVQYDFVKAEISSVELLDYPFATGAAVLEHGQVYVTGWINARCDVSVWFERRQWLDLTAEELGEFVSVDEYWSEHYACGELLKDLRVEFHLTFDEENDTLTSFEVQDVSSATGDN